MSSLLAAGAPASQAVRAVLLPASAAVASGIRPSIPPCSSTGGSPSPCPRPSQPRRQYAMRAPSLTRKDRALRNPSPLARFEASDVPAVGLWENWERTVGELGGLTPAEAREVAVAFCQFTQTEGPVPAWARGKGLDKDHDIHCAAVPMVYGLRGEKAPAMGMHMLALAMSDGHTPSTLFLVDLLTGFGTKAPDNEPLANKAILVHFQRIVTIENNPTAFTLAAIISTHEGKPPTTTLEYLDKAIAAGRDLPEGPPARQAQHPGAKGPAPTEARGPKWYKESMCHHLRGKTLLQLGLRDEAVASFEVAALELGMVTSCLELAKLLPPGDSGRETHLLRAAQGGILEACRLLERDWARKAEAEGLGERERAIARAMSQEWARVVGEAAGPPPRGPRGGGLRGLVERLRDRLLPRALW